jgi:hypothetical protein
MIEGFAARALIALFAIFILFLALAFSYSLGAATASKNAHDERRFGLLAAISLSLEILLILCLGAA